MQADCEIQYETWSYGWYLIDYRVVLYNECKSWSKGFILDNIFSKACDWYPNWLLEVSKQLCACYASYNLTVNNEGYRVWVCWNIGLYVNEHSLMITLWDEYGINLLCLSSCIASSWCDDDMVPVTLQSCADCLILG